MNKLIELQSDQCPVENRRWFSSSDVDLIVWFSETQSVTAFELYYDKNINEHVLIWRKEKGFSHQAVDDGEQKPALNYKEAPILIPDGIFDPERIRKLFERLQEELPATVAKIVRQELGRLTADIQQS